MILSFNSRFIPKVKSGEKIHTLRDAGRWSEGMTIQFYDKMYRPGMYKFREDGIVISIQEVYITFFRGRLEISIDDRYLYYNDIMRFLNNDGFGSQDEFIEYFFPQKDNGKTSKDLIHWTPLKY